jgi:hypothetical protein
MQFKRPTLRVRGYGGFSAPVSPYATGVVADIVRTMRNSVIPPARQTPWTPPSEYKFIASKLPEPEAEMLIARCESWFEANPPRRHVTTQKEESTIDMTPVLELQAKYKGRPPIEESIVAWRAAGLSEERLKKYRAWWNKMEATSGERQKALDLIFVKYPSANKPIPKVKKVIKAVNKKKM